MHKALLFFLGLLLTLTGCNSDQEPTFVTIESIIVSQGNLNGAGEEGIVKQNLIINDESMWNEMVNKMNSVNNESVNFLETEIDFSSNQVIAIFDAVRSSGGYSFEISVKQNHITRIVELKYLNPESNVASVITQPYVVARIPKSELPIIFQ